MSGATGTIAKGAAFARPGTSLRARLRQIATIGGLGVVCVALLAITGGNPAAALAPLLVLAAAWVVVRIPLRWTLTALLFVLLAVDLNSDAQNLWHTPLHVLNDALIDNLGNTIRVPAIKISGLEAVLLGMVTLILYRRWTGSTLDLEGQEQTAGVLGDMVLVWLATMVVCLGNGVLHGAKAEVLIWHARPVIGYALFFAVCQASYRGRQDLRTVGSVIVAAALVKSALAAYFWFIVRPRLGIDLIKIEYATNHWDSITFATACVIVLVSLMEEGRKRVGLRLSLLPLLAVGMVANNRRLVWVALVLALGVVYAMSPWRGWKRSFTKLTLLLIPVVGLYLAVGWDKSAGIFGPAKMVRSVIDSKSDRSTWDRDVENWNMILSLQPEPILGRGFGTEYTEFIVGDDISAGFPMFRSVPHNALLGWFLFCGVLGFTGLWSLWVALVYLAARVYRRATVPLDRVAALTSVSIVMIVGAVAYGDMGLLSVQAKVLIGLALAFIGKLAVATGAWPRRQPRRSLQVTHARPGARGARAT